MSVSRRLLGSFGASIMGPAVTALVQIINVPVMLRTWGPQLYGEWLLLSAAPAYLLLSDFGFGNVAGTDMTLRVNANDREGALETYQSTQALVLMTSAIIALAVLLVLLFVPLDRVFHFESLTGTETRNTLLLLSLNCLIILQWSLLIAGYRCTGQYAQGMLYVNSIRVVEGASLFVVLFTKARPVELAALMLAISIAGTAWLLLRLRSLTPWLSFGFRHASHKRLRELRGPAFAFMAFPAGNALSTQGMTLLVGLSLGPLIVAVYNPMRTLSRFVLQLSNAVMNATWPELSAAFGRGDIALAKQLHRWACQSAVVLSLVGAAALTVTGPRIFALWTHGRVQMNTRVFYVMLLTSVVYSSWNASSAVPLAINKHQRLAVYFLLCAAASLGVTSILLRPMKMMGAAVAALLCDLAMSVYVTRTSNKLLDERWSDFAAAMLDGTALRAVGHKLLRRVSPRTTGTS